jgi:DNA (cytosine-5)-methyltransferase 1
VIIENVPEFLSWGPLDSVGRPIQGQKGKTFRAFISSLRSLGYTVDWQILTAADYGDPTTRRRLFIQAVKGRKRILWPEITHMDGGDNGYKPWRPAREIIDWSIPGTSIFDRKRPLADATIHRIARGIEKYWKDYAEPFLAVLYGTNDVRSLDRPLPTVTTCGSHHALVQPFLTRFHGGRDSEKRNHSLYDPMPTLDTSNRYGLVEPFITNIGQASAKNRSRSIDEPLTTIVVKAEHCLIEPFTKCGLDIRFRMLKNHELKKAQGFPDDYVITGNITEQTKQIGNAVPVNTAKALAEAAMSA